MTTTDRDTVTYQDVVKRSPDLLLPATSRECAPAYWEAVLDGEEIARDTDVTILGLARNTMPWLTINTARIEYLGNQFRSWRAFVYENDSTDGTQRELQAWSERCPQVEHQCSTHNRPQLSTEKSKRRTDALAEYRQACLEWARSHRPAGDRRHRIIVIDLDTWGGWSAHGVMSGLAWMNRLADAAGLASVSTIEYPSDLDPSGKITIHYDAWAFRLNHWTEQHDMGWFHGWFPPVGSEPVRCCSAFGGMAIYQPEAFFAGTYSGGDCEHVNFHRSIYDKTGMSMYLNPGQRLVMNWIPQGAATDGRQHGNHLDAGVSG
jgi:hypothetical protein